MLKEENQRRGWKIKDLDIVWDFLTQVNSWDGKCLAQPLSVFSHVSKEKIVVSLIFFCCPTLFFFHVQVSLLDIFAALNEIH